jgi:hypothetical protein
MLPIEELREREPTPAATALALFVAGRDVVSEVELVDHVPISQ